jgi:hypothetical protein
MMLATATRGMSVRVLGLRKGPAVEQVAIELASIPGVASAKVVAATGLAYVSLAAETSHSAVLTAVRRAGFAGEILPR